MSIAIIGATGGGGGGSFYDQSLNTTDNVTFNTVALPNTATIEVGSVDTNIGGSGGISLVCVVGYELNWQSGYLKCLNPDSSTRSIYCQSPIEFPTEGPSNVKIDATGITFGDGSTLATANDPRWNLFLPVAPTSVTGTTAEQAVDLTWTAPAVDPAPALPVTDYAIQYSDDNGATWTPYADVVSTATSVTVTGLTNGTAYQFRVRAINAIGLGSYSTASGSVTPAIPVPTGVTGTAQDGAVALTWTAPSPTPINGVTDYVVQYSDDGGSTWATFDDGVSTDTLATVTGLTNGTGYTFRVAAITGANETSGYSNASATVTPSNGPSNSLLMHFDGANGSTTFTDSSPNGFSVTASGNAVISTAQSQFGGASAYLDDTSTLTVPYSTAIDLQTGDWTVEFWYWSANAATATSNLISVNSNVWLGGQLQIQAYPAQGHGFRMLTNANGSWVNTNIIGSFTEDQWYHIAAVRSGSDFYFFVNGVLALNYQYSGDLTAISGPLVIGNELSNAFPTTGYIDELRIIKGVAAYTAPFTPPTGPFA